MTWVAWPDWDARGSWDQGIVHELTAGNEYQHAKVVSRGEGAVVVIPGQHHVKGALLLAEQIADLPWALTIVTSDEEALFPVDLLPRDDRHAVWNQYHDRGMDRLIPIGVAPSTGEILDKIGECPRTYSVTFAGQDTHGRRHELLDTIKDMATDVRRYGDIGWAATAGFREGLSQKNYLDMLAHTRIAPCPSGPHSLDSFRLYEALAAGCLPVVDLLTPRGYEGGFWLALFGAPCPLPVVGSWTELPKLIETLEWPYRRDEVARWWQDYREDLQIDFERTIARLR